MINRAIRFVFTLPIIVVIIVTIAVNVRLHTVVVNPKEDLISELRGLKHLLDKNADVEMQKLYPEGYLFFNALYGLSWCNYVTYFSNIDSAGIAHKEIQRAVDNIFSENCRAVFDRDLPIPYGAFYSGWSAYVLGKNSLWNIQMSGVPQRYDDSSNNATRSPKLFLSAHFPQAIQARHGPQTPCFASLLSPYTTDYFRQNITK